MKRKKKVNSKNNKQFNSLILLWSNTQKDSKNVYRKVSIQKKLFMEYGDFLDFWFSMTTFMNG